jgi:hypothetical protein
MDTFIQTEINFIIAHSPFSILQSCIQLSNR